MLIHRYRRLCYSLLCLLIPCSVSALNLSDGKSFTYDISPNGSLQSGSLNAYVNMYRLRVNEALYQSDTLELSQNGRKVITGNFTEPNSGLQVKRQVYVSKTHNIVRYMEVLSNASDEDKTVTVEVFGQLGAGEQTKVISQKPHFLITDDDIKQQSNEDVFGQEQAVVEGETTSISGSLPALLHYHSYAGTEIPAAVTVDKDFLSWRYENITVPANKTVRLIYFVAQSSTVDAANETANHIFSNTAALYESIGHQALTEISNFIPPVPHSTIDLESVPFITIGETRNHGSIHNDDGLSFFRASTPADVYAITLQAGQEIAVHMSAGFNSYLYLFERQEEGIQLLSSNDDKTVQGINAFLRFTAPATATYYIEATTHDHDTRGAYTLNVVENPANQAPLAQAIHTSTSHVNTPATINFTDFSRDTDGTIIERCWQFNDGSALQCSVNNTVSHTFEEAGFYSVGVRLKDDQGAYAFHQIPIEVASDIDAVVIATANTVTGELTSSDKNAYSRYLAYADRYVLPKVNTGETLVIDMKSTAVDSYLTIYDKYLRPLHTDNNNGEGNNAQIRYTATENTRLIIEASSRNNAEQGSYQLSVNKAVATDLTALPLDAVNTLDNPQRYLFAFRLPADFSAQVFTWDFGDGTAAITTSEANAIHLFDKTGDYDITVSTTDQAGNTAEATTTISIKNNFSSLTAAFSATPLFGDKPVRIFFTNESQSETNLDTLTYIWDFGDGKISTEKNPAHTYEKEGTYLVKLLVESVENKLIASTSRAVSVIDRDSTRIPVVNTQRVRPQVIMSGIDPILVDANATEMTLFAIVRAGASPIQTVRVQQKDTDFIQAMHHVATYANGDQRYETLYHFPQGLFSIATLGQLYGEETGQFTVQAVDQAGQFHSFPNLEVGQHKVLDTPSDILYVPPPQKAGIKRPIPQVLGAGFDPALVEADDASFMVKAIVRQGDYPIQKVTLKQNKGDFALAMHRMEYLPNGDVIYGVNFSYPQGSLATTTWSNLFSNEERADNYMIEVIDQQGNAHRFPELKIGNFTQ